MTRLQLFERFLSLSGVLISVFSLYIELRKEHDKNYEAVCDINEYISCTKAFMSEYGKGFGIVAPILGSKSVLNQYNSLYGIIFYSILGLLGETRESWARKSRLVLSAISVLGSVYLANILYSKLNTMCVVCVTIYIINIGLFLCHIVSLKPKKIKKS